MWNCSSKNMTERSWFFNVLFLVLVIICCAISQCSSGLSNKRLCYDPDCSEPVSLAKTLINYMRNDEDLLSFRINEDVKIYSKDAGTRDDLWGVEINGKRGYVPKALLKEYKILHSKLKHIVPIKPKEDENKSVFDIKIIEASSNSIDNLNLQSTPELSQKKIHITPPYEVVDGTTVHLNQDVSPVHTKIVSEAIEPTVLVNKDDAINDSGIEPSDGSIESNILIDSDKVTEVAVLEKVQKETQKVFDNVNINDFVTSSEQVSNLPEVTGIQMKSLDRGTVPDTVKYKTGIIEDEGKAPTLNQIIENNIVQSISPDESKGTPNIEGKAAVSLNEHSNFSLSETVAYNDIISDFQIGDNNDIVGTPATENEAVVVINRTALNIPHTTVSDRSETKDVQFLESQSSTSEAVVATSDIKPATQEADSSDTSETKEIQSPKSEETAVTDNVMSDTEKLNTSDMFHTKEVQFPESEETAVTNNIMSDRKKSNISDTSQTKEVRSPKSEETAVTDNIMSDTEKLNISDISDMKEVQFPESEAIDANNNVKLDAQETHSSNTSETNEVLSPKSEETAVTDNIMSDTEKLNISDISDMKEVQSPKSEAIDSTINVKSDTQKADISDTLETKDAQSAETHNEAATFLENLMITTNNNMFEMKHEKQFGKIEVKDTDIPESITVDINNNTEAEVGDIDAVTITDEKRSEFIRSITSAPDTPDMKDVRASKDTVQLTTEKTGSQNKNSNNNKYMSSSFLQLSAMNKASKTIPSDNIKVSTQNTENISGHTVNSIQHDSNIEDTVLTTETASNSQPVVNILESVSVGETILDVQLGLNAEDNISVEEATSQNIIHDIQASPPDVCTADSVECSPENNVQDHFSHHDFEDALMEGIHIDSNYWMTLMYLSVTAIATLIFSLGYYRIENMRRDRQLIARINKLEKELLISDAELTMVNENLKSTKEKLNRMEDESFGSDEMVLSLRADLESLQNVKVELEDQVVMLEKDLESATEAGLELEKMLREVLSANNDVNPLAQSVEDLQTRLNAQQAANESLTNALGLKTQENESLSVELRSVKKKYEELEVEFTQVTENLRLEVNNKNSIEQTLNNKVQQLEMQIKEISTEKATLRKKLKGKEVEASDLVEVINKLNSNNLDLDKLYNVSHIKAEATTLLEERNELKIRLAEVEGAYNLLEEHVKVVKEEMAILSEQCKTAEKEKKDAETRLEVLTNFFEEKEAQRQKEEAIWLQQQGEVVSTVERIQMLQNEIQNYKQQVEMLKREILDQEREYKGQISLLETKAHEQWVIARQVERHLEESKVEAGQLRNRLTLIEKNLNDVDLEAKLHRLTANGESTSSPPLFMGAEPCNYPIMFSGSTSGPLPPPPSYLHSLFPPYLPPPLPNASEVPPYEVNQRPPPLGARLSSPPPMPPLHPPASNRYDNAGSLPPMSPHLLPPPLDHRSPLPPYSTEMYPPPPPPGSILPPSLGAPRSWGEESLPPPRNSGFHPAQRERVRNHKGSLHSSGESLDKSHHSKV